jgi:hypothetical protein
MSRGNKLIHEVDSLLLDELAARLDVNAHHDTGEICDNLYVSWGQGLCLK